MSDLNASDEIEFSFELSRAGERLAATMCTLFRSDDFDFGLALLANSTHVLEPWTRGEEKFHKWRITAPPKLFVEYKRQVNWLLNDFGNEIDIHDGDFHSRAWYIGEEALCRADVSRIDRTLVEPAHDNDPAWRRNAQDYLTGQGVNNQGNVFLTKHPRIVHDELFFRSMAEANIHDALIRRRLPFMPLPVVMRADGTTRPDKTNRRIEPDFVVLLRGRMVVIEIDGGTHTESPAEAHLRLKFLQDAGALVERFSADRCKDSEGAALAVADLLKSIDRRIDAR